MAMLGSVLQLVHNIERKVVGPACMSLYASIDNHEPVSMLHIPLDTMSVV